MLKEAIGLSCGLITFSALSYNFDPPSTAKVIYGNDDRQEVRDAPPRFQKWAKSIAVKMAPSSENYHYEVSPVENLCPEERFAKQTKLGNCTGVLVAPDMLLTAGHCAAFGGACDDLQWIFGYQLPPYQNSTAIKQENIYSCAEVIYPDIGWEADIALVRLDRTVLGRTPLRLRRKGAIAVGEKVGTISSSMGHPLKVVTGARVREVRRYTFTSNLDVYKGASGSPVINLTTGLVEGILVRGEDDFIHDESSKCYRSKRCEDNDCRGEMAVVTKDIIW